MKILLKIAWRNIWRNPRRSWVLITSIAVGVFGYLGTSAFSRGFLNQMIASAINLRGGHILISAKGFYENPNVRSSIKQPEEISGVLSSFRDIASAPTVELNGMINSTESAAGVIVNGILPQREVRITTISKSIVQGQYLTSGSKNEIIIGQELAHKLHVRLGEKVVLMTSDLEKNISSAAFRICGLFKSSSADFDKAFVYIHLQAAQKLAGYEKQISSFTLKLAKPYELEQTVTALKANLDTKKYEILTWQDRNKLLELSLKFYDFSIVITVVILFTVIAFSIANAFLMVIYERIYEFGVMMANGVFPKKIRHILYIESFFITFIGTVVGFIVTGLILGYWKSVGLDLSSFAKGLSTFGVGAIIYPDVTTFDVLIGVAVINVIVFCAILYPAHKASRFEVVDAIRFE